MAIFTVLAEQPNAELKQKITESYPANFYELTASQWLVSSDTIAQTLAEQLDLRTGKFGRVIVIQVSGSASGWHNSTVWEWLTQKAKSI